MNRDFNLQRRGWLSGRSGKKLVHKYLQRSFFNLELKA